VSGAHYFVFFKDDFSGFRVICPMKQKSEVYDLFKQFVARLFRGTGKSVTVFRSDGGGDFTSGEFELYLANQGIRYETSAPHTPQQNGVSERENRTIMEATRSMLHGSGLPLYLWEECVNCAAYILNRVLSQSTVTSVTPYEAWFGTNPNVSHFRPFGCLI
jgi:transposase InsO family protein